MAERSQATEVQYLVLPDAENPYLLARVRWPDVAQAISIGRPDWQNDPGLFDLPYEPSSVRVTGAQAASIAAAWGTHLVADTKHSAPSLIRRMPANWSNLVPAERHAWSLEFVPRKRRFGRLAKSMRRREGSGDALDPEAGQTLGAKSVGTPPRVPGERRRHTRVNVYGRAQISFGENFSAVVVNISEGGVHCVVSDAQSVLDSGGRLEVPFLLEDEVSKSQVRLDVASSVTWQKDIGTGTQLGVVFAEMDNDQVGLVQEFLATVGSDLD